MDGIRRWARRAGLTSPSLGHRHGADHLDDLLHWCTTAGITRVTVFVCSTENLGARDADEVAFLRTLMQELADKVRDEPTPRWRLHLAGQPDALPAQTAAALKAAVSATRTCTTGNHLTLAIGYGGRQELLDAMRNLLLERAADGSTLEQVAHNFTAADIAEHLYTAGQPEPDLIIRTSGEQRLSNFLLWQSAYSELYFCDAYWPAFREVDFLRALRSYAGRQRRYGR
ncbi:polyprenyl diphosphate synthase [Segeticoccus rhizosphaerae]|jgi:short-chain Z-isoprenyl diphosphate synthase|uniref:polyprenyl diphosphate synthase n=1 Tax=Segeticoccus rhizosphaerae TaxID=1104777 RepID=UPI001EE48B97|nr:polyprenyl diphosphate synthase [Ornithinicoccus soli]